MKNTLMLLSATLVMNAPAFAKTITCNEIANARTEKYGYYQVFNIRFGSQNLITEIEALNWNAKTNQKAGHDMAASRSSSEKPLSPKKMGGELVYSYSFQGEGDGDFPGPKTRVTYRLPESLQGRAEITEDAGSEGKDVFVVNCQ